MKIEEYLNLQEIECVMVTYEDGTIWSGLKSAFEEEQLANMPVEPAPKATKGE